MQVLPNTGVFIDPVRCNVPTMNAVFGYLPAGLAQIHFHCLHHHVAMAASDAFQHLYHRTVYSRDLDAVVPCQPTIICKVLTNHINISSTHKQTLLYITVT